MDRVSHPRVKTQQLWLDILNQLQIPVHLLRFPNTCSVYRHPVSETAQERFNVPLPFAVNKLETENELKKKERGIYSTLTHTRLKKKKKKTRWLQIKNADQST